MLLLEIPSVFKIHSIILLKLSFDNSLINGFSQLDGYRYVVSQIFSDFHCASCSLCRPLAVSRRHSYSGTAMTSAPGTERISLSFLYTILDTHPYSRKMRTCCRRNGNSRFVSHLDFRASETIPHPLLVLSASLSRLFRPIPQHSVPSASYEPTEQLRRGFTQEISPATTRCGNVHEIRATWAALS